MKRRDITNLLTRLTADLAAGDLTNAALAAHLTDVTGGTDAAGAWSWRQAYDLVQAAAILADPEDDAGDPAARLARLTGAADARATETRRSEIQVRLQQFSTPLPFAHVAAVAAAIRPGDVVLEPSAGTGALAHMARRAGGYVVLNELDPFRTAVLQDLFGTRPTRHDAEHIDDLLDRAIQADVVLMNPPFSSSAAREGDPTIALRHALSAAKRLAPGGRLVAILPLAACAARQPILWARLMRLTELARANGTLDVGIETLRADRIAVVEEADLWTCPKSGSVTRTVTLECENEVRIPNGATVAADHGARMAPRRNAASGKVALISKRASQVFDDDVMAEIRETRRPTGRGSMTEDAFASSHWEPVDAETFVRLWDAEVAELPLVETHRIVLLTGLLLPIWRDIPSDSERIWRVTPEDGVSRIGRAISPEQAVVLAGRFRGGETTPAELVAAAMAGDGAVDLGRGLTLRARRVAGTRRLEVEGWRPEQVDALKAAGCFTEIVAYQLRAFVPVGDDAPAVIEAIRAGGGMKIAA